MSNNQTPNDTPKDKTKVQAFFATVKERFAKLTKTQKIVSGIVGAIVVLGLIAIPLIKPLQEKLALASIGSSPVKITVNSAETIIPYDGDEDSTYIAYNVTFENTSSKSMNFTSVIELVNDEGEALSPEYVYDSTEKFETIQSEILSIGKNRKF
ncbi:hypothetical protein [Streptococcus loxodontisalivarius]|uniref:DUF4352 domain-containing protein n=1 Tax=Streptococcus loxodontisalivarius TaxID=1349415 RepID=A0ABS2PUN5_9STRE|nr:hypothetical protein [Streptococcus loxodontisalivarius]MBM7643767.1 hypothetical protein [Streptococcus loxodontisalivarius]